MAVSVDSFGERIMGFLQREVAESEKTERQVLKKKKKVVVLSLN